MGKKGRRTRWRTLSIADENSDSEESNTTTSGHRVPKTYSQKYYSRFTYSSQSTPTRRYQYDGTKSTRSSSTASENKITFNEDEYTRITTPRQDVLFKKGYLNKPKTYQSQTSTGNSTTSTGNSTGNGTPDHQSTDLEYESQFVFPNGFVDQNGIYYVNSFEPFPVMVFNPPTYYPEYTNVKSKRCSTGSLTESTSPNNEETSQDLSQSETPSNLSDLNQMYNVLYPGYYYNGVCQPPEAVCEPEPQRRVKKRRRRKLSRSKHEGTTSESSDEVFSDEEVKKEDEEEEEKEETTVTTTTPEVQIPVEDDGQKEKPEDEKETQKEQEKENEDEETPKAKYDLKPDAEEFVPRAYRQQPETIPVDVQFIKIPPNFVPVPILNPMGDFNAFIPTGIPINFIPQNFVNFVPYKPPPSEPSQNEENSSEMKKEETKKETTTTTTTVEVPKNAIDIAKIVSKLEEAAKEQNEEEEKKEESVKNNITRKRFRYQKVDLRKPESPKKTAWKPITPPHQSPKKEEAEVKKVRNYSDTLKKFTPANHSVDNNRTEKTKTVKNVTKEVVMKTPVKKEESSAKPSSEWIPVSRKKRKTKIVEETEDFEEIEEKTEEEAVRIVEEETIEVTPPPPPPPSPPPPESEPPQVQTQIPELMKKEETKKPKKKSKKNHAKTSPVQATKRVIITDVDLSVPEPSNIEETPAVKNEETKTAVVIEEIEEVLTNVVEPIVEVEEEAVKVEEEKKEEKKSKKKKKKIVPKATNVSDSNATSNLTDDSYDFLLDESIDKTNVEVSQELDRMIQRGMYTNLEEKIKALNMPEPSDAFFRTIISNISSRESSVEKNTYLKPTSTNLRTLLGGGGSNTTPTSTTTDPKSIDFLYDGTTTSNACGGGVTRSEEDYPLTRAVKEWMTKTRETTPDVELLKSPSTILREFGMDAEDEEEVVYKRRISSSSSVEEAEEVYESKYGLNEDYNKIKEEIEELKSKYPKHGNLPYRAICCSIM